MALSPTRGLTDFTEHTMSLHLAGTILGGQWLYCPALGWMEWDGLLWRRHPDREALRIKTVIRSYISHWLQVEMANLLPFQAAALERYLRRSGLDKLEGMLKTVEGVTVEAGTFDADGLLVNTPGGVLDLLDGTLTPHLPLFRMTRITGAPYRPGARHTDWEQALRALPDAETARWLQCYLGRGLLGRTGGVEVVPFLIGTGSNGKSLIIGAALRAVGGYGGMVIDALLAGKVHEEHLMRLRGLRLAVVEELADGHRLNVSRLKQILGTDKMIGRHLYREPVEWEPSHTLVVTSNYQPVVPETDHGTWRRLVAVPFPREYEPDADLKERCLHGVEQQEAVLAWLVEGATTEMPAIPAAMAAATNEWRMAVDLIAQFLDECCVQDPAGRVTRADMLGRFNEFAKEQGHRQLTGRTFVERFRSHKIVKGWNVEETTVHGSRQWAGVSLKAPYLRRVI